jgi:lipid II isoglutaminyl synthase (glutamine-hydrolysing)
MIIEILYPEIASLYGEQGNLDILRQSLPEATFIKTTFASAPVFATQEVDLILMGPSSEEDQLRIIEALRPYKNILENCIQRGTHFLLTGNAMDAFGMYLIDDAGQRHEGLGILDFYVKQDLWHRYNGFTLGTFMDFEIVGHKSQFSMVYGDNTLNAFFPVKRGIGINEGSMLEGIHYRNFYATSMLGPILVLNPLFTRHLFQELGKGDVRLPFEADLMAAYTQRVKEFNDPEIHQIH